MRTARNIMLTIALIAAAGIGINAFAHGGMGKRGGMMGGYGGGWGHHGPGWHHGCGNDRTARWGDEDYRKFEEQHQAFIEETREIRSELFDKERELYNELAKDMPDASRASQLQKDISELRSVFDQKRIEHMIELKKQNPNIGRGFMGGRPGMGYGSARGGYCWK